MVKKCKKLHACLKKAKYNNVLKLVEEILDTYPEATFVRKFRLISYFEMGDYIKTIKSGKKLLENEIKNIVWEDIFWIVIAAYMQVDDIDLAKEFYYLFKEKHYIIIDFDREKLQFLMKINPEQADRYKTAIFFKEFLSTFHKITNNRLKHLTGLRMIRCILILNIWIWITFYLSKIMLSVLKIPCLGAYLTLETIDL